MSILFQIIKNPILDHNFIRYSTRIRQILNSSQSTGEQKTVEDSAKSLDIRNSVPYDLAMFKPAIKITKISGLHDRVNDVLYSPPCSPSGEGGLVIFFGGDMQDFHENMAAKESTKEFADWCLEKTSQLLSMHYKNCHILVVRPSSIEEGIFSKYSNFVPSLKYGVPKFIPNHGSLQHLRKLIENLEESLKKLEYIEIKARLEHTCKELRTEHFSFPAEEEYRNGLKECNVELVGFSKGCVVLNQILHEFHHFKNDSDVEIGEMIERIKIMRWLDGGHNGHHDTWITAEEILETFAKLGKQIFVHVTPYQVCCEKRPWIGKEEAIFTKILTEKKVDIKRKLHFENSEGTLSDHFNLLLEMKSVNFAQDLFEFFCLGLKYPVELFGDTSSFKYDSLQSPNQFQHQAVFLSQYLSLFRK